MINDTTQPQSCTVETDERSTVVTDLVPPLDLHPDIVSAQEVLGLPIEETPVCSAVCATLPDPEPIVAKTAVETTPGETETIRDAVVRMVLELGCELFHDSNSSTFVSVPLNGRKENWRLRSEGFRRLIRHRWHQLTGQGIGTSVVLDALDTLDAVASFSDQELPVHIRIAHFEKDIYVDLCDDQWRVVHISADGWKITENPPVRFIRTKGMLPLPVPVSGGRLDALRPLINAPTDEIWCLVVAWLLSAFSPGPFPVLVLLGEQGCAKSFMCRVLRQLIDPSEVEITSSPKEARDVIMAAVNSHVLALDNLSGIPGWLSDLLCSIATGAAHRERKFHTNNGEEELFKAKRPTVLNGIDFAMRDDLLSRSFLLTLPVIADNRRQNETELWTAIRSATPDILGGIFDTLSSILKSLPTTHLATLPRMADAALWVTAAETALGWTPGQFMTIYGGNREKSADLALESDSFGLALREHMTEKSGGTWSASWQELVDTLSDGQTRVGWPKNSKAVATRLVRLGPALRHGGVHWTHEREGSKRFYKFQMDVADVADVATPNGESAFNPQRIDFATGSTRADVAS